MESIHINQEVCAGCFACFDSCETNAITMINGKASINQQLCTQCENCMNVCPVNAIYAIEEEPEKVLPIKTAETIPVRQPVNTPVAARKSSTALVPMLLLLGKELLPRVTDLVINSIENRKSGSIVKQPSSQHQTSSFIPSNRGRHQGRPHRIRRRRRGQW